MKYQNSIFVMLLLVMFTVAGGGYAAAQDAKEETKSESVQQEEAKRDKVVERLRNNNPYLDALHKASVAFIKDVPDEGVATLLRIREVYGIIRSIHQVKRDVGNAVKLCGEANEDLKTDMDARFDEWSKLVTPAVGEQEKKLDAVIKKQAYKTEEEVRDYLKHIDDAAEYADKMLDKQVVTTPKACTGLRDSMDKTGPNIVQLLEQTEMPPLNEDGTATPENKGEEEESSGDE